MQRPELASVAELATNVLGQKTVLDGAPSNNHYYVLWRSLALVVPHPEYRYVHRCISISPDPGMPYSLARPVSIGRRAKSPRHLLILSY